MDSSKSRAAEQKDAAGAEDGTREPGREALIYHPSRVSWAVAEAVARPPASLARVGLYLMLAVLGGAVLFAHFTTVALTVSGRGLIRSSAKVRPIRALVTGRITRLHARNGDRVAQGDVLVAMEHLLSPAESSHAADAVERTRTVLRTHDKRAALDGISRVLDRPLRLGGTALLREVSELWEAQKQYQQALTYLLVTTPELHRPDLLEKEHVQTRLAGLRTLSPERLADNGLTSEVQDLEIRLARVQGAMADRQTSAERQLASARTTLETTLERFVEALQAHDEQHRITAPVAGTVSNVVATGDGELVASGQDLLQVIPDGGELVAELDIANRDIGELSPGMPVKLKLDAFPFQEYGAVGGVLREVPPDVHEAGERGGQPTYKVVASLDARAFEDRGTLKPILLGMSLSADVQTRQRTLLQLAVQEVLKLRSYFE